METEQPKSEQQPAVPESGGGLAAPTLLGALGVVCLLMAAMLGAIPTEGDGVTLASNPHAIQILGCVFFGGMAFAFIIGSAATASPNAPHEPRGESRQ